MNARKKWEIALNTANPNVSYPELVELRKLAYKLSKQVDIEGPLPQQTEQTSVEAQTKPELV